MKKHFALYFTYIVNAMIAALEKHNGIPFNKIVEVWEHEEDTDLKTILISFSSRTSFFRYSIGIIQRGHLVGVELLKSFGGSLSVLKDSGFIDDEAAETIGSFYLGKEENISGNITVVPVIQLARLPKDIRLDVPKERGADMVQTLLLISNLLREVSGVVAQINSDFKTHQPFKADDVQCPDIIKEAQKEEGMLTAVSF